MSIDRQGLEALSRMARIPIAERDFEARLDDIGKVLAFVQQIEAVTIPDDLVVEYPLRNIARSDDSDPASEHVVDAIRAGFPDRVGDHAAVAQVLNK